MRYETALKIKRLRDGGAKASDISREFGVSVGHARLLCVYAEYALRRGRHWTDVFKTGLANSIKSAGFKDESELLAAVKSGAIYSVNGIGKKSIKEIRLFFGLPEIDDQSSKMDAAAPKEVIDAISILEKNGYVVYKKKPRHPV